MPIKCNPNDQDTNNKQEATLNSQSIFNALTVPLTEDKIKELDNDALTVLSDSLPQELRYFDDYASISNPELPQHLQSDSEAVLFLASLLRSQLEINNLQEPNLKYSKLTRLSFSKQ